MSTSKVLNKGDLVLITGGTGWVGSHIVEQALKAGLRVRLAYRDANKAKALIDGLKTVYPDAEHVELTKVDAFEQEGAYDEAVKGVDGVVHAASVLASGPWDEVVPPVLAGVETILRSSAREKSIKRFVLTSSSTACGKPNVEADQPTQHFDVTTWNEGSIQRGKTNPLRGDTYAASKALGEKLAWSFVKDPKNDVSFVLNTVLPNACTGKAAVGQPYVSTGKWWRDVVLNADASKFDTPAQWCVDTDDVAVLHVLALMQADVQNERILAFGAPFTWDQVVDLGKQIVPNANVPQKNAQSARSDNTTIDTRRTEELLKPYGGLKGFEYTFKRNFDLI